MIPMDSSAIPIPLVTAIAIALFIASAVLPLAHFHAADGTSFIDIAWTGLWFLLGTLTSSLLLAISLLGLDIPLSGSNYLEAMPFWIAELSICALLFAVVCTIAFLIGKKA